MRLRPASEFGCSNSAFSRSALCGTFLADRVRPRVLRCPPSPRQHYYLALSARCSCASKKKRSQNAISYRAPPPVNVGSTCESIASVSNWHGSGPTPFFPERISFQWHLSRIHVPRQGVRVLFARFCLNCVRRLTLPKANTCTVPNPATKVIAYHEQKCPSLSATNSSSLLISHSDSAAHKACSCEAGSQV